MNIHTSIHRPRLSTCLYRHDSRHTCLFVYMNLDISLDMSSFTARQFVIMSQLECARNRYCTQACWKNNTSCHTSAVDWQVVHGCQASVMRRIARCFPRERTGMPSACNIEPRANTSALDALRASAQARAHDASAQASATSRSTCTCCELPRTGTRC